MSASKRDELIEKALDVFYRDGFHATGMDKLVAETGVSKTSMYKHFRTKEDLILATLRLRSQQFEDGFLKKALELASTPEGQILACFDLLEGWINSKGFNSCFFIKASSEYLDERHPIHCEAAAHKARVTTFFAKLPAAANLNNPERLARQLMLLQEGAITEAHLHGPCTFAADAKAAAAVLISAAAPR